MKKEEMNMKTMDRKRTNRIQGWLLLILAVWLCGCNEKGDETIVIEDGQPAVATLIVGRWRPVKIERINKNDENDRTDESSTAGEAEWEFFKDGGFGRSDEPGKRFDWHAGEKDDGVSIGGIDWHIRTLSKGRLIVYRSEGDYWLVYYLDRIGEYIDDNEEGGGGDDVSGDSKVTTIVETTAYSDSRSDYTVTHRFGYDDDGRVDEYTSDNGKYVYSWDYFYEPRQVVVRGNESYRAGLNDQGFISRLWSSDAMDRETEVVSSVTYDGSGYKTSLMYPSGTSVSFRYDGKDLAQVESYTYRYSKEKNDANIDLNCLISNCSKMYELGYSHYTLFAPFGLYGRPSEHLIASEDLGRYADFDYVYAYERDGKGRIVRIVRECILRATTVPSTVLNTTTFDIVYDGGK